MKGSDEIHLTLGERLSLLFYDWPWEQDRATRKHFHANHVVGASKIFSNFAAIYYLSDIPSLNELVVGNT